MKRFIFIPLLVVTVAIIFILLHHSHGKPDKSIYVALNGNDQNNGTISKPFRTLKKAASEAKAGTTVFIRKGTYNEKLVIKHSGTPSKPVIFTAYKNEKVVLSGKNRKDVEGNEGNTALISMENKNYISIDGLTIQDLSTDLTDETVMGIFVTGSSSHIHLKNNHVQRIKTHADDGNAHGIAIYGTGAMKDINIMKNTVEDLILGSSESLVLNGNIDGFKVENNLIRRNNNIGIDLIGYEGISNNMKADRVRNGVVKKNNVYEISSYSNPAYGKDYAAAGIYVDGGKTITIKENTVYESDIGVEVTSEHAHKYAENISVRNNTIYNNFYTGIAIGGYDKHRGGTKNAIISRNIIYKNDTKGLAGGQLLLQYDTKNNVIEKNIFTAGPSRLFIANYFMTNQKNRLIKNVFHKEKGKDAIWVWKDKEYTSFPKFQIASKSDKGSQYLDPKYKNAHKHHFQLKKDSPAASIVK
ncbi:right-handed parallel beta-helix repeat-containing protein [Lentibacillus sp. N15]|uniref:right-handed parallel beta-helix repeat-containing protein n=1 Tax=Lentibacillus songyuanensis TaxID=3136161 RepID=UPI0031BA20D5